jgi:TolA-binding protein
MTNHVALLRTALTTDDRLDDLARVRIWNELASNLAADRDAAAGIERRRRTLAIAMTSGITAAALAAAIAFIVLRPSPAPHESTVADGTSLTLPLGPHGHAQVVGSARFEVVGAPAAATTVRIDAGVLLAEFSGGPGRSLKIVAPHVTVDVVGTLFAVDVRLAETCVSVEHGTVRLTWNDRPPLALTGGHRYCTGTGAQPIAPETRDALLRHERVITAAVVAPDVAAPSAAVATPPATLQPVPSAETPSPARDMATSTTTSPSTKSPSTTSPSTTSRDLPSASRGMPASSSRDMPPSTSRVVKPPASSRDMQPPSTPSASRAVPASPSASSSRDLSPSPSPSTSPSTSHDLQASSSRDVAPSPSMSRDLPSSPSSRSTSPSPGAAPRVTAAPPTAAARDTAAPDDSAAATPPVKAAPLAVGPDDLYRDAEAALVRRDLRAADRMLARLVTQHPQSALVEQALYDRARIAYQQRAWSAARSHLDSLLALPAPRLVEQARYLECRIAVDTQDNGATSCLDTYRRAYPRSPHAADTLAMLVQLDHAAGGCVRAAARIAELVQQHPSNKLAKAWRARCAEKK